MIRWLLVMGGLLALLAVSYELGWETGATRMIEKEVRAEA